MDIIIIQMIKLFGLILIGYTLNKLKILDEVSNKKFSTFLVNVTIPALIISSSIGQGLSDKEDIITVVSLGIGMFILLPMISTVIVKILNIDKTYKLMLNYSNLGFMGIPIISSIYGDDKVFYVCLIMMTFNISIFSHGIYIIQSDSKGKFDIKSMLNPGIISAVIAIIIYIFSLHVNSCISDLLGQVGGITTPLAMIVIGSTLAEVNIFSIFNDRMMYVFTMLKMIIYPLIIYLILIMIIDNSMIIGLMTILCGLPTAGNVSMVCSEYDGNIELASKGICITTAFSLITLPLLIMLVNR